MTAGEGSQLLDLDEECKHGLKVRTCALCRPSRPAPPKPKRPTTTPRTADDPIAPLSGTKDLSTPMRALAPYLGERTDWLAATGGYPHDLRPGGWVYLWFEERLATRVRVRAMAWREERPVRTGDDVTGDGFGAGLVFEVDPATWEAFDQPLGEDAEWMRQGYRYHLTGRAGRVHHLMADDPVPEGDWDE